MSTLDPFGFLFLRLRRPLQSSDPLEVDKGSDRPLAPDYPPTPVPRDRGYSQLSSYEKGHVVYPGRGPYYTISRYDLDRV